MKLTIDTDEKILIHELNGKMVTYKLFTREAFELISHQWLKVGWGQKYSYSFSWMGRPLIQLPEDLLRIQEVLFRVKPNVLIETGVAHGGSLIYYASLFKAMGKGKVIGIDIEIRPQNRKAIESHELSSLITLVEGSSTSPNVINHIKSLIQPGEKVFVILDSCHTKQHVLNELEAYHSLVSPESYIVATDGVMKDMYDVPNGNHEWIWNNPSTAAIDFSNKNNNFVLEQPIWPFNESGLTKNVTYWPTAFLRCKNNL